MKLLKELVEQQQKPLKIHHDVRLRELFSLTGVNDYSGSVVMGTFDISHTKIASLQGSPGEVTKDYFCNSTDIRTLHGVTQLIGEDFFCSYTKITSFEGGPAHIGKNLYAYNTDIISLHNIHKHLRYIGGHIILPLTVRTNFLGLLKIEGLKSARFQGDPGAHSSPLKAFIIINKHLEGDRNIHACQEELLEAGLPEAAKL